MNLGGFKALSSYNTERHFLKYLFKNVCPLLALQCAGELSGMSQIRNVTALPSRVKTKILQKNVQGELMKSFPKSMGGAGLHPALLHWASLPPCLQQAVGGRSGSVVPASLPTPPPAGLRKVIQCNRLLIPTPGKWLLFESTQHYPSD